MIGKSQDAMVYTATEQYIKIQTTKVNTLPKGYTIYTNSMIQGYQEGFNNTEDTKGRLQKGGIPESVHCYNSEGINAIPEVCKRSALF